MLITPSLLCAFNGIHVSEDEAAQELLAVYIGTAQQIISDYVGFDADEVVADGSEFTEAAKAIFKDACLRVATLLQLEGGGNLGVSSAAGEGQFSRSYLNVVDYTPYLKPLSAFRRNTGM